MINLTICDTICSDLRAFYYFLRLLLGYLFSLSSLHNIIFNGVTKRKRKKYSQIRGIMEQHFVAWDVNRKKKMYIQAKYCSSLGDLSLYCQYYSHTR